MSLEKFSVTCADFPGTCLWRMMNVVEDMPETVSDVELVAASRAGDREAYGRIVERYQQLICTLAYSATGDLAESEDLAQETFVDGWRQLGALREAEKLRPWLCGILRHKVGRLRRSDRREPARQAEGLENADELPSGDEPVPESAMLREEQVILWKMLEQVPPLYREPLILFYREHRSVEHVAVALELSEDAVKQRLSRGRQFLQERMLAFVERGLSRSTPGRVFTLAVLAALPEISTPAKAAGIGVTAAKGGFAAKSVGSAGLLSFISGVVSTGITLRTCLDQSRTPTERRAVVKITLSLFLGALGAVGVLYLLRSAALRWSGNRAVFAGFSQILVFAFAVFFPWVLMTIMRRMRDLRTSERLRHPNLFADPRDQVGSAAGEYRSGIQWLGVPLVHIRYSSPDAGQGPVFGWFACGDRAIGLLCAWGGIAVAPFCVGGIAVGVLSIGTVGVGIVSIGTAAVGLVAMGCMAVGVKASAWLSAMGWYSARSDGFAIARTAAEAPIAFALHANDSVARQILFDRNANESSLTFVIVVSLLTLIPVVWYARAVRRRFGKAGVFRHR